MLSTDLLKGLYNDKIGLEERRPGLYQLYIPLYHEDGDMVNIYLQEMPNNKVRVSDLAVTLMRLSYTFDLNSSTKESIFHRILSENQVAEDDGNLYIDSPVSTLVPAIMALTQAILKISSMQLYKRETIDSLFYEQLAEIITTSLGAYSPKQNVVPLLEREELEVDWSFTIDHRPIFLFGVNTNAKARLSTIACLEFQLHKLPFRSVMVHEDFDGLSRKDRSRITSASDKQFISLADFKEKSVRYFEAEAVITAS